MSAEIRVAIADDHKIFRKGVILSLRHYPNIKFVLEAENGEVALEILKKNKDIELVLTDLHMPEMDGLQMSSLILANQDLKNVSIVMLTTEATGELKEKAKSIGIKAWIPKPYKNESVMMAVKKFVKY